MKQSIWCSILGHITLNGQSFSMRATKKMMGKKKMFSASHAIHYENHINTWPSLFGFLKKGIIKGTKKITNLNDNVGEKVQTIMRIEEIKRKANVLNDK